MNSTREVHTEKWEGAARHDAGDRLVVEEPLEIRLAGAPVAVTMRTPGHDAELAAGFLFTEGILASPSQVGAIARCDDAGNPDQANIVDVLPAKGSLIRAVGWQRSFYATSSCGICGKASIEAVRRSTPPLDDAARFNPALAYELPDRLRKEQPLFAETGALHAAALFGTTGDLEIVREDVGRHNAVDKVIGSRFLAGGVPLRRTMLVVSGRASFEIVQKALMAGIPGVSAISGVSTLAVELARESGMLLIGFLRGRSMRVYAGAERLQGA
jgi:FdhD protein